MLSRFYGKEVYNVSCFDVFHKLLGIDFLVETMIDNVVYFIRMGPKNVYIFYFYSDIIIKIIASIWRSLGGQKICTALCDHILTVFNS